MPVTSARKAGRSFLSEILKKMNQFSLQLGAGFVRSVFGRAESGCFNDNRSFTTMKKLILLLTALAVTSTLVARDFPKGSPKFVDSHRKAMSTAKKEGKPVVLVFTASWCPPCQVMKKSVYPSDAVKEYHDKFVWAYLDVDDKDNDKPSEQYGVNPIPHIEFVDADGKPLVQKQVGSGSPEDFAKRLAGALAKAPSAPAVKQ